MAASIPPVAKIDYVVQTLEQAYGRQTRFSGKSAVDQLIFHKLLFRHGQQICTFNRPKCHRCVIREGCDYFQALTAGNQQPDTAS